ncbi:MAG: hypothetical protein LUE23_07045 [Lachnospiraceae bacterium]|nr:hypothetical protein [Lachnospiraceae bacterium]
MLDREQIFSLNFLSYGGMETGDHHGMRYRMVRAGEKPDVHIDVCVWPEPFCYDKTPEEKKLRAEFPFSEEGREQAIDWLQEQYDSRREAWDHAPGLLAAMS